MPVGVGPQKTLQNMISGIPLILGLGTRMSDPHVYVVFWALKYGLIKECGWGYGILLKRAMLGSLGFWCPYTSWLEIT